MPSLNGFVIDKRFFARIEVLQDDLLATFDRQFRVPACYSELADPYVTVFVAEI